MILNIVFSALVFFGLVSSSSILYPFAPGISTIYPDEIYQNWTFATSFSSFEVNVWRSSFYLGPIEDKPVVSFSLYNTDIGTYQSSSGQLIVKNNQIYNYEVLVKDSVNIYTYMIRYCPEKCSATCPVHDGAFCSNYGACTNSTSSCDCDVLTGNTTTPFLSLYDCYPVNDLDLWLLFFWLWIVLIVVGSMFICCICIVICYCGGLCAVAAISSEKKTLVQHVYVDNSGNQYRTTPDYNKV